MSAAAERIPRTCREMSGDFGEILAAVYVEERTPFVIPIRRLRYKADREFPMHGDDIVGLARDGSARLLKGEAKSRDRLDETTVQAADDALNARDGRPKAETLGFLSMRLRELEEDEVAERIASPTTDESGSRSRRTKSLSPSHTRFGPDDEKGCRRH